MNNLHISEIVYVAEWWSGSTCTIFTDDDTWAKMGNEHALIVMNHSFEVDWLMVGLLALSYVNMRNFKILKHYHFNRDGSCVNNRDY